MKLCIVAPGRPRFLAYGTYLEALVPHFLANGLDVVVLSDVHATGQRLPAEVSVQQAWDPDSPLVAYQQLRAIEAAQPDVVCFQTGLMMGRKAFPNLARVAVPCLVRNRGLPTVVTLHNLLEGGPLAPLGVGSTIFHRKAGRFATSLLLKATRVCFTLQRYVELAERLYGAANAIHIPLHTFGPVAQAPIRPDSARFLTFGSLAPFKGIDVLLEAVRRVRRALPQAQFCIAGGLHHRYPRFAREWGSHAAIDGKVMRWLGQVSDPTIDRLMNWTDIVVNPNTASTGSSSVIHRAVAHGKPIIASDLPDFRAVAEEERLSVEFALPNDPANLAGAMIRLAQNADLRARAGAANAAAAEALTPSSVALRYVAAFQSACSASSIESLRSSVAALPLAADAALGIG